MCRGGNGSGLVDHKGNDVEEDVEEDECRSDSTKSRVQLRPRVDENQRALRRKQASNVILKNHEQHLGIR